MKRDGILNIKKTFSPLMWIYISVFSLIALKSITVTPFSLKSGMSGLLYGILLYILVFIVSLLITSFLLKVGIKQNDTKAKKVNSLLFMLPGIIVSSFMWLCYYPAIIPFDTAYIWYMTSNGFYNNMHPIIYVMYVQLIRVIYDGPQLLVLIQILYCSFVYGYVAYVFYKHGVKKFWCYVIAAVLALIPVNATYSISVIKDVSYIMTLVFMSAFFVDYALSREFKLKQIIILVFFSLIALFSRHNGLLSIPLVFLTSAFINLLNKNYKQMMAFILSLIILFVGFYGTETVAERAVAEDYTKKSNTNEFIMIPAGQVAYISTVHKDELSDYQLKEKAHFVNTDYYYHRKIIYPTKWAYNFDMYNSLYTGHISENPQRFIKYYFSLVRDFPKSAATAYGNLTGIAWCSPNHGYTFYRSDTIADYEGHVCAESNSLLPNAKAFLDKYVFSPNEAGLFLWRPALYMVLSLLLLLIAFKRHGKYAILPLMPALGNTIGYLIICPSQCVRYLYCNVSVFVVMLVFALIIPVKTNENTESTK